MIVVFDTSVLIFLFEKDANAPLDASTAQPLVRCYDRVNHLIVALERDKVKILIPTPSLAEIMVKAGAAGPEWLSIIMASKHIRIVAFDQRAAIEYAAMQQERRDSEGRDGVPREKAKFDDQIIAIARVEGAKRIYSDDQKLGRRAAPGIETFGLAALALPPEDRQMVLPLAPSDLRDEESEATQVDQDVAAAVDSHLAPAQPAAAALAAEPAVKPEVENSAFTSPYDADLSEPEPQAGAQQGLEENGSLSDA